MLSLCVLTWQRTEWRARGLYSLFPSYKDVNPIMEDLPSRQFQYSKEILFVFIP
jgi:hypothetical protein